jgi:hypothetical protein
MLKSKEPEIGNDNAQNNRVRARTSDDHARTSRDGTHSDDALLHSHSSDEAFQPRPLRLDFPRFDGEDPEGWCYRR